MSTYSLTYRQSVFKRVTVTNVSQSFTYKMAAKTRWHRYMERHSGGFKLEGLVGHCTSAHSLNPPLERHHATVTVCVLLSGGGAAVDVRAAALGPTQTVRLLVVRRRHGRLTSRRRDVTAAAGVTSRRRDVTAAA